MTTSNVATRVIGTDKVQQSIRRRIRKLEIPGRVLEDDIRLIVDAVLEVVPYVEGGLFRSFRLSAAEGVLILRFTAKYANRVHETSRRNAGYFRRGLRTGIRRANANIVTDRDGESFRYRFTNRGIRRANNGGLMVRVAYRRV